jgi:hypothetical protein
MCPYANLLLAILRTADREVEVAMQTCPFEDTKANKRSATNKIEDQIATVRAISARVADHAIDPPSVRDVNPIVAERLEHAERQSSNGGLADAERKVVEVWREGEPTSGKIAPERLGVSHPVTSPLGHPG